MNQQTKRSRGGQNSTGWKRTHSRSSRQRRRSSSQAPQGLDDKVAQQEGGRLGFGLVEEDSTTTRNRPGTTSTTTQPQQQDTHAGLYGGSSAAAATSRRPRARRFHKTAATAREPPSTSCSTASQQSTNPYKRARSSSTKNPRPAKSTTTTSPASSSSRRTYQAVSTQQHVVCAVSENLAKETCVASIDAGAPVGLHVTQQANGQTYAETLSYLQVLQPDEILLNEGRRHSPLARKICDLVGVRSFPPNGPPVPSQHRRFATQDDPQEQDGPCPTTTVVKFVPRAYFDQTKGGELLSKLARPDATDGTVLQEYILLSSSHAVLLYTQLCLGANFAQHSLDLVLTTGGSNRMALDRSSLLHLELLANSKTGKAAQSLIGTLDCCKTTVGSRLLRTNLMAPPTQVDTIETRLDLVDAFLGEETFFYQVLEQLECLPDVNKMLTHIALVPWNKKKRSSSSTNSALAGEGEYISSRVASKGIYALVCIKSTLSAIPALSSALQDQLDKIVQREQQQRGGNARTTTARQDEPNGNDDMTTFTGRSSLLIGLGGASSSASPRPVIRHHLLRAILATLRQPGLATVLHAVTSIFTESTTYSRNAHAMRHQECFALKPKTDGMMDVLRKAFLANVDDIYRLADEYAETYGIHVTVKENVSRGYYLALPAELASDLPQVFIQAVKSGRFIHCTTEEVHSLNGRAQDNVQDLLVMTHERIQEVLDVARSHYDTLAALSDAIALLDLCHCFADNVASSNLPWCRPIVSDELRSARHNNGAVIPAGDLKIKNGRYGIDVSHGQNAVDTGDEFVPNDTYASKSKPFTVITGVNGSGKSTYLKQLAIIVLMAHCGSYVPAEEAIIPIRDRLCTRIGTADDQAHNISTFMLEMKETAFVCNNATDKSLILIDELGRATSNEDGVAIAWAVSEHLLAKGSMTFFVTHYPQIAKLSEAYPAVQNQHLGSTISGDGSGEICYTHKIVPGPCTVSSDYGVEMAVSCGWPAEAIQNAKTIRADIEQKLPDASLCLVQRNTDNDAEYENGLELVAKQLQEIKVNVPVEDIDGWRHHLEQLRKSLLSVDSNVVEGMKQLLGSFPSKQQTSSSNRLLHKEESARAMDESDTDDTASSLSSDSDSSENSSETSSSSSGSSSSTTSLQS